MSYESTLNEYEINSLFESIREKLPNQEQQKFLDEIRSLDLELQSQQQSLYDTLLGDIPSV